jgi:suppressor for copper-sensitivity B
MQIFLKTLLFLSLALQNSFGASSLLQNHELSGAKTSLIASSFEQNGVKKLVAGVEFQLQEGWKIYGNDDSGMGMPPEFNFSASQNYKSHNIFYPQALDGLEKIGNEEIKYKYYKNSVIFPIFIENLDQNQITKLNLKLSFALCKDVCVPVNQDFSIDVDHKIDMNAINKIEKFYGQNLVEKNLNSSRNFSEIDMSLGDAIKIKKNPNKIYLMILLAMFGGLILNIMPCVLPVISIKLISVLKHSGAPISKIRFSFFATIIGILSCFVVLALFSYVIQSAGSSLGWGFQFQNPFFLIFLITILAFFIAELLGIFEISFSQFLATILDKKISEKEAKKNIFMPNFLSGILAVLLATPCSAPFLGSAISFALTQDFLTILLIFIFIGIGFSSPYFILIASPKLINLLPKPGKWMIKIKHLMAGFLFATAVWLSFVLSNTIGLLPALLVAIFSILIFCSLRIKTKMVKVIFITILIILSFTLPFDFHEREAKVKSEQNSYWQVFDESILQNLVSENKIIIVDVTADWCLTCKFNKFLVLNDKEIVKKLKSGEVIGLRADITQPDSDAMKFLAKHNRYAIPFNAVYGPNAKNGLLASEFLNKKQLLDLIEKAR